MECFARVAIIAWDVLSGERALRDILSRVAKKGMECFALGCFINHICKND